MRLQEIGTPTKDATKPKYKQKNKTKIKINKNNKEVKTVTEKAQNEEVHDYTPSSLGVSEAVLLW